MLYIPVCLVVKTLLFAREVWGLNSESFISDTVSPQLPCFFGNVLPRRSAAEMGPANRYSLRRATARKMKISWMMHHLVTITMTSKSLFCMGDAWYRRYVPSSRTSSILELSLLLKHRCLLHWARQLTIIFSSTWPILI